METNRNEFLRAVKCIMEETCENRNQCRVYGCQYSEDDDCMLSIIRDAGEILEQDDKIIKELSQKLDERPKVIDSQPIGFWANKTVLVHEVPVSITREVYCADKAYVEGYDAKGRYYEIPLHRLRLLSKAVDGWVEYGKGEMTTPHG